MTEEEFQAGGATFGALLSKLSAEDLASLSQFFGYLRAFPQDGDDAVRMEYALFIHRQIRQLLAAQRRLREVNAALHTLGIDR